ncbi:PhzF family phenazine biosynthesis protein [Acetobacteraceae bacterium KSS8]|uniref:PhzF family phenazine biosynthesis protein n=1 Tax=Endosaccharibacter trunci TaxID=2812733 RepID=A0ABT1W737_9PROT|nr:PhzF family phenazine biosynthesis protein [Acetobacteraceae bacterium KSS8]
MGRRYVTVDVFTDRAFGGNPLAVVLDAAGLDTQTMQRVAREFGYSETTFVLPPADPAHHACVRIFTPEQELPFAGHPNVGTAFVLAREWAGRGEALPEQFLFEEAAGLVPVRPWLADGRLCGAELTAPIRFERGETIESATIARILRLPEQAVLADPHPPLVGSAGLPFLLVRLRDTEAVDAASVDEALLADLLGHHATRNLYLYARIGADRVHARMLAPLDGIGEDPATGSAAAALGGLLGALDGAADFTIAQGVQMGRPSEIRVSVSEGGAIRVGGACVTMMQGELLIREPGD